MPARNVRWGIMGAANIARKNWLGIRQSGAGIITAVASREEGRARQFIEDCQSEAPFPTKPQAVGDYESLLTREDVDAVYVPLPTGRRKEWVLRAAAAGKHVLCEKPCGVTAADLKDMIDACRQAGVLFMDGVMFMHSGRLPRLREVLDDGKTVGKIKRVTSQFSFLAGEDFWATNIRAQGDLEPLGCLGDLGWYCLRMALWIMNGRVPLRVTGRSLAEVKGAPGTPPVPTEFSGELIFEGGVSSGFYCSFVTELQQWVHVCGTRGGVYIPDFVLPFAGSRLGIQTHQATYSVEGCQFAMRPRDATMVISESSHGQPDAQEARMFRAFQEATLSKNLAASWADWSWRTQLVLDAVLDSARRNGAVVEIPGSLSSAAATGLGGL